MHLQGKLTDVRNKANAQQGNNKKKKIVIKSFRDMPSALFLQWLLLAMLAAKMRYWSNVHNHLDPENPNFLESRDSASEPAFPQKPPFPILCFPLSMFSRFCSRGSWLHTASAPAMLHHFVIATKEERAHSRRQQQTVQCKIGFQAGRNEKVCL